MDIFKYAIKNKLRFNYRDMEADLQLAVQHGVDKEIVKSLLK